jgi:hypothetical protein
VAKRCSFRDTSVEIYLWITVPMIMTTEVPQTATLITGFDFVLVAMDAATECNVMLPLAA